MKIADSKSSAFDFQADYVLEDSNVLLRPLTPDDFGLLRCFSEEEPELWQFNAGGANGSENLKLYLETASEKRSKELAYPFIVWDKASQTYAGSTRLYDFQFGKRTVQIGFTWYGKKYQGTGINKSCKALLLDFAFSRLGMERVGFAANAANLRSIHAMKGIGCTVEGILRSSGLDARGERIDNILLSILRSEWESGLKENLAATPAKYPSTPVSQVTDLTNAEHYIWGEGCLSYIITDTPSLSVKQEIMPCGTKERLHFHARSMQVFHVLKGEAAFYIDGTDLFLQQGQSIMATPGQKHYIANNSREDLEFLVISQPSTTMDRINVT